jgi:hypothetical protein
MTILDEPELIGYQRPRILHTPTSAVPELGNAGQEVVELAALAGLDLDDWQAWFIGEACALRPQKFVNPYTKLREYKWAAFEVGLTVARQNGKGSILEARELAGLFLFGERLIIHSAHQFDTSLEAFQRIMFLLENTPDLEREIKRVSRGHGEEGIEMKSGQRLRFRTRTKGGGRGFTGDCLILDEAMILDKRQIGALLPTLSARPNPQVWYTGSAGEPTSTQQGAVRARAIRGGQPRLLYGEFSADVCTATCLPDCVEHDRINDPETWAKTNPAMGIRVSMEHIAAEFEAMDKETFLIERLSVGDWPADEEGWRVIAKEAWEARHDETSVLQDPFVLGVYTQPDRSMSTIVACGLNQRGFTHIEIPGNNEVGYDHRSGIQWLLDRVPAIFRATKPKGLVIDPSSQAGELIADLEIEIRKVPGYENFEVWPTTSREYAQACGALKTAVQPRPDEGEPTLVHLNQRPLAKALGGAETRKLTDLWAWDAMKATTPSSPICAATLAMHGLKRLTNQPPPVAPWVYRR